MTKFIYTDRTQNSGLMGAGGRAGWRRGTKAFSRVTEIFGISIDVWVTRVCALVKTHRTVQLRSVPLTACELPRNC